MNEGAKQAYLDKAGAQLKVWGATIEGLKAKVAMKAADVRIDYHSQIESWQDKETILKVKMEELRSASADGFETMKAGVQKVWNELTSIKESIEGKKMKYLNIQMNKQTNRILNKTLFLPTLVACLSACSHGPAVQDFADTASPGVELAKFDADMNAATANQVNVLSPRNFKDAQESLKDAKRGMDKQQNAKDVLHSIAQGQAYLTRANEFAKLSHANIEEVILARQAALTAGAPGLFASDFRDADESLRDVTSDIEKNELKNAIENRASLQLKYLDIELRSIKQAKLGQSRNTVAQAEKEGAKDFAPRSLAIAKKSVQDTDAFITANRHDSTQIALRSDETIKSTDHLLKITRDSKSGKKATSEELALRIENEQNLVANKQDELSNKENQLENKQAQVIQGENSIQALESEKALNQRFEEARTEFTESEAEVYKQGNTLMIRLRGLEFPVSQAVLKGSNFPLLAKVQKVIKSFGRSSVIVEGHTDSNGGKALNEKLSSERAHAVSEYLLSNSEDKSLQIKSIGYDYQKPLATNKTPSGRAQNRRVDVLIQPETGKGT